MLTVLYYTLASLSFFSTKMSNFWGLPTIYTLLDSLLTNFLWTSCCENMGLMAHSHRHLFEILRGLTCFLTKKTSRGSKTQFHTYTFKVDFYLIGVLLSRDNLGIHLQKY